MLAATATTSAATTAALSMTEITCSTCLIKFDSKELRREHMREDWHVYNLKRRIASLPPLSITEFHEQALTSDDRRDGGERYSRFQKSCDLCDQHFNSQKAWKAHLQSRNHDEKSNQVDSSSKSPSPTSLDSSSEAFSTTDEKAFNPSQCLFCPSESTSLNESLKHMSFAHSFFIPDVERLIDIDSFLSYLSLIISEFHECLYCGIEKSSAFAVQEHMREKGHCKFELGGGEGELREFWDFDEEGEGTEEEEEEEEGEMIMFHDEDGNGDELRLPSGKILSHRSSRARHSRHHPSQRRESPTKRLLTETETDPDETPDLDSHHRSLVIRARAGTSTSLIGVPKLQQRALMAMEKKEEMNEMRNRNEYQSWLEKGGNKQKRFKVKSMGKKQGGLEKRLG